MQSSIAVNTITSMPNRHHVLSLLLHQWHHEASRVSSKSYQSLHHDPFKYDTDPPLLEGDIDGFIPRLLNIPCPSHLLMVLDCVLPDFWCPNCHIVTCYKFDWEPKSCKNGVCEKNYVSKENFGEQNPERCLMDFLCFKCSGG